MIVTKQPTLSIWKNEELKRQQSLPPMQVRAFKTHSTNLSNQICKISPVCLISRCSEYASRQSRKMDIILDKKLSTSQINYKTTENNKTAKPFVKGKGRNPKLVNE